MRSFLIFFAVLAAVSANGSVRMARDIIGHPKIIDATMDYLRKVVGILDSSNPGQIESMIADQFVFNGCGINMNKDNAVRQLSNKPFGHDYVITLRMAKISPPGGQSHFTAEIVIEGMKGVHNVEIEIYNTNTEMLKIYMATATKC